MSDDYMDRLPTGVQKLKGAGEMRDPDYLLVPPGASINATLATRQSSHGDFTCNGQIMQSTKLLWRQHEGWDRLTPCQHEALEMIAHKVGRILCGNPNFADHWHDIAGYARLAEERCT